MTKSTFCTYFLLTLGFVCSSYATEASSRSTVSNLSKLEKQRDCLNRGLPASCHDGAGKLTLLKCASCETANHRSSSFAVNVFEPKQSGKAVIIYTKGGDSCFRWHSDKPNGPRGPVQRSLVAQTEEGIAVLMPDFPCFDRVKSSSSNPGNRADPEYMRKLETLVDWAAKKYKSPIFMFGHSNGNMNHLSFYEYLLDEQKTSKVSGFFISEFSRTFYESLDYSKSKFAVVAHENSGCLKKRFGIFSDVFRHVKKISKTNPNVVKVAITGGVNTGFTSQNNRECAGVGHHMYTGAEAELQRKISDVLNLWVR